jgi:hypothetical protein
MRQMPAQINQNPFSKPKKAMELAGHCIASAMQLLDR